jgi:hypothetical protein
MKVNSAFTWNDLEEILVNLLRVLWREGFKTDICGGADPEGRPFHPLTLIKMTHPAQPERSFVLSSVADKELSKFNLKLEVGGDRKYLAYLDVFNDVEDMLAEVMANLLIFSIESGESPKPPGDGTRWTIALGDGKSVLIMERGRDRRRTPDGGIDLGIRIYTEGAEGMGPWCHDLKSVANRLNDLFLCGIIEDNERGRVVEWLKQNVYFYPADVGL